MSYSVELLTSLKAKRGGASDYAIAKELEITPQTFTKVRNHNRRFSNEITVKFAHALEINPAEALARIHLEKENSPIAREVWQQIIEETIALERLIKEGVRVTDVA